MKYEIGPMACSLDVYLTRVRLGVATEQHLRDLFKLAEKADKALAYSDRDKQNSPALGRLIDRAEKCGIDNWRDLSAFVVEDFCAEAELGLEYEDEGGLLPSRKGRDPETRAAILGHLKSEISKLQGGVA